VVDSDTEPDSSNGDNATTENNKDWGIFNLSLTE
jgi:hypothetical protein